MPCSRKNSSKDEPICGFFFLILISPKGRCIKIDTPRQAPSFRPIGTSEAQRCTKKYQKETGRVRGKGGRRVGEDVATLTPHRPGRAELLHPVLRERASLTVGVDDHSYRSSVRGRPRSLAERGAFAPLASMASHCRFVDRFVGLMSPPVFPANGSLHAAPPFPPSGSR